MLIWLWQMAADVWSLRVISHCFSCTCWDKERAHCSAQPRVVRNDRKSNWLHAMLSRETRPRASAEEQIQWMTKTSGVPSPSWSPPQSASHQGFTRMEIKTLCCISVLFRDFCNTSPAITSHGCFLKTPQALRVLSFIIHDSCLQTNVDVCKV